MNFKNDIIDVDESIDLNKIYLNSKRISNDNVLDADDFSILTKSILIVI